MIKKTDPDAVRPYTEDASGLRGGHADAVYLPADEAEAASLLADCTSRGEPLTLSGAGTGLTGARVPFGGSVLATDAMGGLRDLRVLPGGGGIAVVGPALSVADLEQEAASRGLFYPPDPTERKAWIGGTVATNASGSRTFRYGPTRRWIRRVRLVLASGEIVDLPRGRCRAGRDGYFALPAASGAGPQGRLPSFRMPRAKNAAGYHVAPGMDLVDLLIGSEGTLALVTEVELALLPAPEGILAGVLFLPSEEAAWSLLREARWLSYRARGYRGPASPDPGEPGPGGPAGRQGVLDARALEYFGSSSLEFMRPRHHGIPGPARAAIHFEQETSASTEEALSEAWSRIAEAHGALLEDSWFGATERERRAFRDFRHALPEGINDWLARHGQAKIGADMAVPDSAFDAMMSLYRETLDPTGLTWVAFGHLGDNHLHVNILPRNDAEAVRGGEAYGMLVERILALGGTISAEHGVGKIKVRHLAAMYGDGALEEMANLKRAFDPALILGRGNVIPEEMLGAG